MELENLSRRSFIKGAVISAAGMAAAGMAASSVAYAADSSSASAAAPSASAAASASTEAKTFTPGAYVGSAQGNSGLTVVETVFNENAEIESVKLLGHGDTDHLMYEVEKILPQRIVDAQSTDVDAVSGATISSFSILSAVEDCIEQAGGDVNAYKAAAATTSTDDTVSCDALVIGSGPSGLAAANTLQEGGVDVLLVDMLDFLGGNGRFSAGRMFGTLDESNLSFIHDEFMKQTVTCPKEYDASQFPNTEKVDQYVNKGYEFTQYMQNTLGIPLQYYGWKEGMEKSTFDVTATKIEVAENDYSSISSGMGFQMMKSLIESYANLGGRVMTGVTVTSLKTDDSGAVIGADAVTSTGNLSIDAKYVIVTTGSAAANKDVQKIYCPEHADDGDERTIGKGSDGSGIVMMADLGAEVLPDWINSAGKYTLKPELARTDAGQNFEFNNLYATSKGLFVDSTAIRRGDESNGFITVLYYTEGEQDMLYAIYDATNLADQDFITVFEQGLIDSPEFYFKGNTLEELAMASGLDAETLVKTIETYNGYCDAGTDDDFGKAAENLIAIKNAPFYAIREIVVNRDLAGGVRTDINRNVLDESGNAIAGLYSAGFASSRDLYGSGIPGAGSVGMSLVSGYVVAGVVKEALGA